MIFTTILTEAMERECKVVIKSYGRFFPNQDFMPEGGLGNLVALLPQGRVRRIWRSDVCAGIFVSASAAQASDDGGRKRDYAGRDGGDAVGEGVYAVVDAQQAEYAVAYGIDGYAGDEYGDCGGHEKRNKPPRM